ncbi:HupE/UreJ family protein [Vibrio coralliilyticus]|uniref:HupE/UreJ family protein n=1 Tax=Vibrio coralliilyticus TaxID=190893 RepID=UPI000C16BC0F|nr:HupE/UreJ family protein [Vibrio coralliilyticus]
MKKTFTSVLPLLLISTSVLAHPGHDSHSFSSGLTHPVTGFDHLIMLVAFGILIACLRTSVKRQIGLVAAALMSLVAGLAAGQVMGGFSAMELAIGASLFVVSGAIWQAFHASENVMRLAVTLCIGLIFFHGYAHGVEAQGVVSAFAAGMVASASALILLGMQFGRAMFSPWLAAGVSGVSALVLI